MAWAPSLGDVGSTDGDSILGRMVRGPGRPGPHSLTRIVISSHTRAQTHSDTSTGLHKHSHSDCRHAPKATQRNMDLIPMCHSKAHARVHTHLMRTMNHICGVPQVCESACEYRNVKEGLFCWCHPGPGLITLSRRVITAGTPPPAWPTGPCQRTAEPQAWAFAERWWERGGL